MTAAAKAAIAATGAASVKDMGKVVYALKEAYPGQMDFAKGERDREEPSGSVSDLLAIRKLERSLRTDLIGPLSVANRYETCCAKDTSSNNIDLLTSRWSIPRRAP